MSSDPRKPGSSADIDHELEPIRSEWQAMEQPEPPELLDQAVRNAARRELESAASPRRRLRWLGGFATAAVVVVALSLVVQQQSPPGSEAPQSMPELKLDESAEPADTVSRPGAATTARREKRAATAALQKQPENAAAPVMEMPPTPAAQAHAMKAMPSAAEVEAASPVLQEDVSREQAPSLMADEAAPDASIWIDRMLELHEAGQSEELERELAAFLAIYPDYPLPAVLQEP